MTTETNAPKNLAQKMAQVMIDVTHVEKNGKNDFHKYKYATEADMVAPVRHALAKQGVCTIPRVVKEEWVKIVTKAGKEEFICRIKLEMDFTDGEKVMTASACGEGQDAGDKAFYKAMTGATKYVICKTFLIPTGDDPEIDSEDERTQSRSDAKESVSKIVGKTLGLIPPSEQEKILIILNEFSNPDELTAYGKKLKEEGKLTGPFRDTFMDAYNKKLEELKKVK
jgi:hypothetical protein